MGTTPFYQDPNFYMAITSIIAIFLSLRPDFKKFRKAKLDLDLYNMIWVTHMVGNPIIQMSLIIKNIGGRNISIENINVELTRDREPLIKLPLQHYYDKPTDKETILFKKFTLIPNEEWNHHSKFLNFFKRDDSIIFKESDRKLKNEIQRLKQLPENLNQQSLISTNEHFAEPFKKLFDKHFIWKEGNYTLTINIQTEGNIANISKSFSFTIFKALETEFIEDKSKYSSGDRIFWYSDSYYGEWIELEEKGN